MSVLQSDFPKDVHNPHRQITVSAPLNRCLYKIKKNHHFFTQNVHFLELFLVKFWKNFNKPSAQNLNFFIDRQWFIGADTVLVSIGRLQNGLIG